MLQVGRLRHGGIMANYRCTAACRHCLYACSPKRTAGYISESTMADVCRLLRQGGCHHVHVGGGEPFMNFEGLLTLLRTAKIHGIGIDYVETNGFWANNPATVKKRLHALAKAGADTLCISIDPYHAEYVPVERPLLLAEICRQVGFGFFLWQERFLSPLSQLDKSVPHSRSQLADALSPNYLWDTALDYGISFGGRAVNIEEEYRENRPTETLLSTVPCRSLLDTGHFHVDWRGEFIPSSCTGILLPLAEVVGGIPTQRYPVLQALYGGGVAALYTLATKKGFTPREEGYPSSCTLCFHLRKYLSETECYPELDSEHYQASLSYY